MAETQFRSTRAHLNFITERESPSTIQSVGSEPTVRHGADLGYIPVVVKDACGFGHRDAAARSIASLEFAGDALLTNVETICTHSGAYSRSKRLLGHDRTRMSLSSSWRK